MVVGIGSASHGAIGIAQGPSPRHGFVASHRIGEPSGDTQPGSATAVAAVAQAPACSHVSSGSIVGDASSLGAPGVADASAASCTVARGIAGSLDPRIA